jgi:NifU-like protein involved in Fe-S cluster formation
VLLVVAMVAGVFAALIGATPASAHFSSIVGKPTCDSDTGNWVITWSVMNNATKLAGTVDKVSSTPSADAVTTIVPGATVPNPGQLNGTQMVPNGTATQASLSVQLMWPGDGFEEAHPSIGKVYFDKTCVQNHPNPSAAFSPACDGTVTVTLSDDRDATTAAAFTVTGAGGFTQSASVAAGASSTVVVPAAAASAITVLVDGQQVATGSWKDPGNCTPVAVSSKSDCTALSVTLDNPAGNRPADVVVSDGTTSQDVTVPAGGSKTLTFPGKTGLTVSVTLTPGTPPTMVRWTPAAACQTTPPAAPTLPVTGSHLGPIIGTGAGLLGLGAAVLYVLYRRRQSLASRSF